MNAVAQVERGPLAWSRPRLAGAGVVAAAAAAGLVTYGAYGDPRAPQSQKNGVPSLIVLAVVVSALVFGWLVPKGLSALERGGHDAHRWALVPGIVALVLCVGFWSGVPMVLGFGAGLLGIDGRRRAIDRGHATRPYTATLVLAGVATLGSVLATVIGNLSH